MQEFPLDVPKPVCSFFSIKITLFFGFSDNNKAYEIPTIPPPIITHVFSAYLSQLLLN
jgi:hypothetical protein